MIAWPGSSTARLPRPRARGARRGARRPGAGARGRGRGAEVPSGGGVAGEDGRRRAEVALGIDEERLAAVDAATVGYAEAADVARRAPPGTSAATAAPSAAE